MARARKLVSVLCVTVGLLSAASVLAGEQFHSDPSVGLDYYLDTHGRVAPSRLPRVYAVFESVLQCADRNSATSPRLVIADDRAQAAAFVLADGTIVLSRRALDLISSGAEPSIADARLAFVLGHELAHLANSDFWERPVEAAAQSRVVPAERQKKELRADDLGFLYAAVAGYRVDALLQPSAATPDFLTFWIDQIGAQDDPGYPSSKARIELLRVRLQERAQAVQSFQFGGRLLQFGRYRDALELLQEAQARFPSREVFNNLGYVHLRLAVTRLPPEFAYHYWLPALADLHTPLARLTLRAPAAAQPRSEWRIPPAAREELIEAVRYFELANAKDPRYMPSQLNLAAALLLLGMDSMVFETGAAPANPLLRAELAIANASTLVSHDPSLRVMAQVIEFEQRRAASKLDTTGDRQLQTNEPALAYNLARITTQSDPALSRTYWRKALGDFDALPAAIRALVCDQRAALAAVIADESLDNRCDQVAAVRARSTLPWPLPVQLSRDLLEKPLTEDERVAQGWRQTQLSRAKVFSADASAVLAIDDITTMVVLRNVAESAQALERCCAQPQEKIPVAVGELWRYESWIAWVRDSQVREVWVVN
jgi:tetratricopeptide (TPR) repeat protein